MGIFHPTYKASLPSGARVLVSYEKKEGKKIERKYIRFKNHQGKTVKYPIAEDGKSVIRDVSKWWIELRDHLQTVRRFSGFTDKAQTKALGRQIERLVSCKIPGEQPTPELSRWLEGIPDKLLDRLVKVGLLDSTRAATGKLLKGHLKDFEQSLLAKGNTKGHVRTVVTRAGRIIEGCGFKSWTDISANKMQRYLLELRNKEDSISVQTSNHYLQAFKQFCTWMINNSRQANRRCSI